MHYRWQKVLKGMALYLTREEHAKGEARTSVYVVC